MRTDLTDRRVAWVDWLKTAGIALIVWGHVAPATTVAWTPPVYSKQLGVAFFVFAMGFGLARERRPAWHAVYNRFFEVLVVGSACALALSVLGAALWSDPNESNFLPLVGAHLVLEAFPANPTTWFIGTHLHLLLIWALLLRRIRVGAPMLAASLALEVTIRALLLNADRPFLAYMLFSNWITVLLMGLMVGQRYALGASPSRTPMLWAPIVAFAWAVGSGLVGWRLTFPFMSTANLDASPLLTSLGTSFVYSGLTFAAFRLARLLPASRTTEFLARNTVVVFVAHMPLYYLLEWLLVPAIPNYAARVTIEFVVCLPLLAAVSEWLRGAIGLQRMRDYIARLPAVRTAMRTDVSFNR